MECVLCLAQCIGASSHVVTHRGLTKAHQDHYSAMMKVDVVSGQHKANDMPEHRGKFMD